MHDRAVHVSGGGAARSRLRSDGFAVFFLGVDEREEDLFQRARLPPCILPSRSSSTVPSAIKRPWLMMPMRSANSSATESWCVERNTVQPARLRALNSSLTTRACMGSRPTIGSSMMSTLRVVQQTGG